MDMGLYHHSKSPVQCLRNSIEQVFVKKNIKFDIAVILILTVSH